MNNSVSQSASVRKLDSANDRNVRVHYNSVDNNNRNRSKTMKLRDFNNFIKWLEIFEYSKPYDIVLDLACGKGGDLEKWRRASIDGLIGIDIADKSIDDANQRYKQLKSKSYWIDLHVGNCFNDSLKEILHPDALPVDVVSCQFALHYAFETEERIKQTLQNISDALKPNGVFFGTIPNSDYLAEKLAHAREEGKNSWGNNIYKIEFNDSVTLDSNGDFNTLWGNEYTFYLREAVDNVPEYVVPINKFAELAKKYNLQLILKEPFLHYFDNWVKKSEGVLGEALFKNLTDQMGHPTFDPEQLEACSIYLVYAFKKLQ